MKVIFTRKDYQPDPNKVVVVMTFEPTVAEVLTTVNLNRLTSFGCYLKQHYLTLDKILVYGTRPATEPINLGQKWVALLCYRPRVGERGLVIYGAN